MNAVDDSLANEDLAPTPPEQRRWGIYDFAALWIGLSICIPTYMLAASLIAGGMSWLEALGTVFLGNVIVLIPVLLNSHAGARYGIPFPVVARASFGVLGANIPALARALVACGWFGIQTWIGSQAIHTILLALWPGWASMPGGMWICFAAFWALNMWIAVRGMGAIKTLEVWAAPFLLVVSLGLLWWAYRGAGSLGPMFALQSRLASGREFLDFFAVSLTGVVGFWATLALNISDFTRYARSQQAHFIGQSLGLPLTMTFYSFLGIAVTSMTIGLYGEAVWNPVGLVQRMGSPLAMAMALAGVVLATLTTNVAANIVSPANAFANAWPRRIRFRTGVWITGFFGIAMMPWKLLADYETYLNTWLVGYSALLGPLTAVLICDYFIVRKRIILTEDLYARRGFYEFTGGINGKAVLATLAGCAAVLLGLAYPPLRFLYHYAWFCGFAVSFAAYCLLMKAGAKTA